MHLLLVNLCSVNRTLFVVFVVVMRLFFARVTSSKGSTLHLRLHVFKHRYFARKCRHSASSCNPCVLKCCERRSPFLVLARFCLFISPSVGHSYAACFPLRRPLAWPAPHCRTVLHYLSSAQFPPAPAFLLPWAWPPSSGRQEAASTTSSRFFLR